MYPEVKTPYLLMSSSKLQKKYIQFSKSFNNFDIYFAVKSNPSLDVLRILHDMGSMFEIASFNEYKLLEKLDIDTSGIIYSNPVKPIDHIKKAFSKGINRFAFDSMQELDKISRYAPGSSVYLRLLVNDSSSRIPLSKKFGMPAHNAKNALLYAKSLGLNPFGITFHVGSQSTSIDIWDFAIQECGWVLSQLSDTDLDIHWLNIGGGFPAKYLEDVPKIEDISRTIKRSMKKYIPKNVHFAAEPGRFMVAEPGTIITSIIGQAERGHKNWLFTDTSAFHGLLETMPCQGNIKFNINRAESNKATSISRQYVLTGPTCDTYDTYDYDANLSGDVKVGDRLAIKSAGAYSIPFATNFNGFPPLRIVLGE